MGNSTSIPEYDDSTLISLDCFIDELLSTGFRAPRGEQIRVLPLKTFETILVSLSLTELKSESMANGSAKVEIEYKDSFRVKFLILLSLSFISGANKDGTTGSVISVAWGIVLSI